MKASCPVVPIKDGKLAPAQKYRNQTCNCENPELYAIFPFRLYGQGLPGLDAARAAYAARRNHLDVGWGYDGNCAALLGLTEEAARILKVKCANSNGDYRWPATWGPNFDWLPDQDHGANLLLTTQLMLLQCQGDKILLLPAWPKVWDVSFRLQATNRTSVEAQVQGGNWAGERIRFC
jgi:alpha-L-fucosidase 2